MKLSDVAKSYYLEKKTNCAVALLLGSSDLFGLGLTAEDAKLVTGFGAGIGAGDTCGCLAGSIGALGRMFAGRTDFRKLCAGFAAKFKEAFGTINCREITPSHNCKETRCAAAVVKCADLLEEYVKGIK